MTTAKTLKPNMEVPSRSVCNASTRHPEACLRCFATQTDSACRLECGEAGPSPQVPLSTYVPRCTSRLEFADAHDYARWFQIKLMGAVITARTVMTAQQQI